MTVRAPNLDGDGNVIPFEDFQDYRKLEFLVPGALCSTRSGVITEWKDARPQPTYDEIEAVTHEEVDAKEAQDREDRLEIATDPVVQAKTLYFLSKEVRALKGLEPMPKGQWLDFISSL